MGRGRERRRSGYREGRGKSRPFVGSGVGRSRKRREIRGRGAKDERSARPCQRLHNFRNVFIAAICAVCASVCLANFRRQAAAPRRGRGEERGRPSGRNRRDVRGREEEMLGNLGVHVRMCM